MSNVLTITPLLSHFARWSFATVQGVCARGRHRYDRRLSEVDEL